MESMNQRRMSNQFYPLSRHRALNTGSSPSNTPLRHHRQQDMRTMRAIAASIVVLSGGDIIASSIIAAAIRHSSLDEPDLGLAIGVLVAAFGAWLIYAERRDKPPPSRDTESDISK